MKTENLNPVETQNQNVNLSEEKKEKYEMARDAAAGTMGGVVGGAAGAVLGSVIAQEAQAQEPVIEPEPTLEPPVTKTEPAPEPEPEKPIIDNPGPEKPVIDNPVPEKPVVDNPVPEKPEPEIQVISYEETQTEEGQTLQFATVNVNGEIVQFAEVTGDDVIDLAAMDLNHDGDITEDEILDVSAQGLSMQALHNMYQEGLNIAQSTDNNEPDYINDGNVNDFIA